MGYKDVYIPEDLDFEDYSAQQRRGEIFNLIIEAGHPDVINQTKLGKRYGVSQQTISKDVAKIRDAITDDMGTDAEHIIHAIFHKGLRELARNHQWEKAMDYAKTWGEFLLNLDGSGVDRAADKHDVRAELKTAARRPDAEFQVVMGDPELEAMVGEPTTEGFAATPNSGDDEGGEGVDIEIDD